VTLNILILITILCWGIWGIFDKKALDRASPQDVMLIMYLLYIPQMPVLFVLLNYLVPGWHLTAELLFWTFLITFTYTVAMVAYLLAMSKAEASYVLGITASYPVVLQVLAVFLLNETLVVSRLLGSALIGLGVAAIGGSKKESRQAVPKQENMLMILCVALATLCWGINGIFGKKAVTIAHPLEVFFGQCLWEPVFLVLVFCLFRAQGHRWRLNNRKTWLFCSLSALSLCIGALAYLNALSMSTASYVIVITGCYPLLMYLFALFVLGEQFNRVRLGGIALVVIGGILVQYTQSL